MKNSCVRFFCAVIVLFSAISLSGCYSAREKAYYADMTNFITEEATVDNIIYNKEYNYIVLWLSGISTKVIGQRGANRDYFIKRFLLKSFRVEADGSAVRNHPTVSII